MSKFPIVITILFTRGAMRPLRDEEREREREKDGTWKGQIKLFLHFPRPSFLIPQLSRWLVEGKGDCAKRAKTVRGALTGFVGKIKAYPDRYRIDIAVEC